MDRTWLTFHGSFVQNETERYMILFFPQIIIVIVTAVYNGVMYVRGSHFIVYDSHGEISSCFCVGETNRYGDYCGVLLHFAG